MKVIQIEYPDKNVHKVVVSEYNHSNDTNLDYINYYDLANDRNMYSILKEEDGKIFNDTDLYDFTYNELIRDIERKDLDDLPSIIPLYMENEKFIYQNQEPDYVQYQQLVQKFIVYHIEDTNRFYVDAKICEKYNVGKGIYIINDKKCKLVTETEIKEIEERSVNHNPRLEAEIKTISFKKEEIKYKVYNLENKILIEDSISKKYNVGKGIFYINNKLCREIAKEELEKLNNVDYLKPEYINITHKNPIKHINVYVDNDTNRMYVDDSLGIGKGVFYIGTNRCKEVKQEDIEKYDVEYLIFSFNSKKKEKKTELVTVYKDNDNDNRLYLTKENCKKFNIGNINSFKYVNNQECYEISEEELSKLTKTEFNDFNVKTKISTVYLKKEAHKVTKRKIEEKTDQIEKSFLVCKYQGMFFIDVEIAIRFGIECRNEVDVEGRIFTQVTEEDIKMIEERTKNSYFKMIRKEVNIEENTKEEENAKTM